MRKVKAKFKCDSIETFENGDKIAKMRAVYGKEGENADFTKFTPSGEIRMQISKDAPSNSLFEPGFEFYVYFERIEKE